MFPAVIYRYEGMNGNFGVGTAVLDYSTGRRIFHFDPGFQADFSVESTYTAPIPPEVRCH